MFERLTDRARKVMALANQEAQRFNQEYIGTEHILLGLVKESTGAGTIVLRNFGLDLRRVGLEVEKLVKSGPEMVTMGKLPQTPRAKKVIEYAIEEARKLNHNYVGTEHLLLGLLREQEGLAAHALRNLGMTVETVRAEVVKVVAGGVSEDAGPSREAVPPQPGTDPAVTRARAAAAIERAYRRGHGTALVLLALLANEENLAARALMDLGIPLEKVRARLQAMIDSGQQDRD